MQTVKSIWDFFQTELLGMSWLNRLIGDLLNACGLDTAGKVGGSVQFFIYDTIKIMVLLGVLILIISYIQSYFPPERTKKILGRFHGVGANCIAALLGTVTPFCSCSSIPLFIGFTSAGLPLGVTFSFLISSPMVDLGSLVLLMSIFGWKVAVLYVVLGLVIAVVGGTLIEKLHLENYVEGFIRNANTLDAKVSVPMAILIWLMIYPMMMKVDFQSIKNVGKNPKGLFVTWITNWLIKPFKNYYQKLKMRFENESETAEH